MQIDVTTLDSHVLMRLVGRFDFSTRDAFIASFKETLEKVEAPEIRIDLAGIVYIDSSALGMLLMARDMAKQRAKEITLTSPQNIVRQTLDTAQFSRLFRFI